MKAPTHALGHRAATLAMASSAALALSGCFQVEDEFTLNPDGSGKVRHVFTMTPVEIDLGGGQKSPEESAREMARDILANSEGIEAWKDVSSKWLESGQIRFEGTAYFRDIEQVAIRQGSLDGPAFRRTLRAGSAGMSVLAVEPDENGGEGDDHGVGGASEAEGEGDFDPRVERAKLNQQLTMMGMFLKDLSVVERFRLPGKVVAGAPFERTDEGAHELRLTGERILAAMRELAKDDELLRRRGAEALMASEPGAEAAERRLLFGTDGPMELTFSGEVPVFDYEAELTAAKAGEAAMRDALGIPKAGTPRAWSPGDPSSAIVGDGTIRASVQGVRFVQPSAHGGGLRAFNWEPGLTLSVAVELGRRVIDVDEGTVTELVGDDGSDLLPEGHFERRLNFVRVSDDGTVAVVDVPGRLPGADVTGFRRVAGELTARTASVTREVDLGISEWKAGAEGKALAARIARRGPASFGDGEEIVLHLEVDRSRIKEVRFLGTDGAPLEVNRTGRASFNDQVDLTFQSDGRFPAGGRIVVVEYGDLSAVAIPFSIENVDLLGRPK